MIFVYDLIVSTKLIFCRSLISSTFQPASAIVIAPALGSSLGSHGPTSLVQITQLKIDFKIDQVRPNKPLKVWIKNQNERENFMVLIRPGVFNFFKRNTMAFCDPTSLWMISELVRIYFGLKVLWNLYFHNIDSFELDVEYDNAMRVFRTNFGETGKTLTTQKCFVIPCLRNSI